MSLSKSDLVSLSSLTVYLRGQSYFRQNRVKILESENGHVKAEVRGSRTYKVSLAFSESGDKLSSKHCNCPAFRDYYDVCKHIVAVVLQVQFLSNIITVSERTIGNEQREIVFIPPQPIVKKSDNTAMQLLDRYMQNIADTVLEAHGGQAELEPVLESNYSSGMHLTFRVGEKQKYIVSDLNMFKSRFENRQSHSYGKNLTLLHTLASFCADSRPLVEFFLRHYDRNNHIYNSGGSYYSYGSNKRNMFLSPSMTDEFFAMFEGKRISARDSKSREFPVIVKREDFRPRLRLLKDEEGGGAELNMVGSVNILYGNKKIYVYDGNIVYCCSEEFTQKCGFLLESLKKSGRMFFAEKDIGTLFSVVLPSVEPYVTLKITGDFEESKPLPLVTKVYFDTPDNESVTARMTFTYGEKTFDAYGEKNVTGAHDIYSELLAESLLAKYFENMYENSNTLIIENDSDAVLRLITEGLDEISQVAEIYADENFGRIKLRPPAVVNVGVKADAGLLNLDFDIEGLDLAELPAILASYRLAKKYHRLRDGSFLMLEKNALEGLSELAESFDLSEKQLVDGHAELASYRALYLDYVCKKNEEIRVDRNQGFRQILRDMGDVETADFTVPAKLNRILRNYQKKGFRWLKTIAAYRFGGILADDMGLGKTLQILALLKSYYDEPGEKLTSVVICPSSLALNWESEVQKFTPELRALVISGVATARAELIAQASDYDLLITSYDALKRDIESYEHLKFEYVIIDEAQYIKNQNTQNAKSVKALDGNIRFALSGTPIENSLAELWSIFDFLMPGYLFSYSKFLKKFEEPIAKSNAQDVSERLKALVRPFLLRRLKKDVLKELPPKTESILRSSMEEEQRKIYAANLVQAKKELSEQAGLGAGQDRIMILAMLTRMRQICCDPSLVYENYKGGSAKLAACMELIESCIESGRRMLLFSQFTSMLDIIERLLSNQNVEYFRIDGSTPPSKRLELVNSFNSGTAPLFLISLKAGGTGLNLTGADVVIHYDPWWNLSAQNQATDRAHRIGQKNSVQVYKLIVKDTIEERILKMQDKKADLANTIIEENSNPFEKLKREELLALLDE